MENFVKENTSRIKESRCRQMIASLSAMRTEECVDVTLVCGDQEFGAHRLVLEASSLYFFKMFRSGLQEAKSGRVVFKSMEPQTLEAILNYVYSGDLDMMMESEHRVVDVLAAAHMMELSDLTDFCFEALGSSVSKENYVVAWDISSLYEHPTLKTKVLEFVLANFEELKETKLLEMSNIKWKDLLKFAVDKQMCLDELMQGVVDWLLHDLDQREKCTSELFACIEPQFLGYNSLRAMLHNECVMTTSSEIKNKVNELGGAVFLLGEGNRSDGTVRFVVGHAREIKCTLRSAPLIIQHLPWSIVIKPTNQPGKTKTLGFYVCCNPSAEEPNWSCNAKLKFIMMVSRNEHVKYNIRKTAHLFCRDDNIWGYKEFACLSDKSESPKDYIVEGTDTFEVEICADAPQGILDL